MATTYVVIKRVRRNETLSTNGGNESKNESCLVFSLYLFLIFHVLRLAVIPLSLSPLYTRRTRKRNG